MPIKHFIKGEMRSADIHRLNLAYAKALRMLHLIDREDPLTEIIARNVVEVGTSGLIDPQQIADAVVEPFRKQ